MNDDAAGIGRTSDSSFEFEGTLPKIEIAVNQDDDEFDFKQNAAPPPSTVQQENYKKKIDEIKQNAKKKEKVVLGK